MHNEDDTNYFTHFQAPATPHEPLSLDWADLELSLSSDVLALSGQQDAAEGTEEGSDEGTADTRPASPGPLEMTPVMNDQEVLPDLPPLPPLDVLPTLTTCGGLPPSHPYRY